VFTGENSGCQVLLGKTIQENFKKVDLEQVRCSGFCENVINFEEIIFYYICNTSKMMYIVYMVKRNGGTP
jgi:hypothetical protein